MHITHQCIKVGLSQQVVALTEKFAKISAKSKQSLDLLPTLVCHSNLVQAATKTLG